MFNLHLTPEQLEFRDTVRDFVTREIKPFALHPDRLQAAGQQPPPALLKQAAQMGLRTLALSEQRGGAGADQLTSCIVAEELAAGDVGIAAALLQTSMLSHALFDQAMTPEQRTRLLPGFMADDGYHLAYAGCASDADLGWNYHRPPAARQGIRINAVRQADGDWMVNGATEFIANGAIAKLFAVAAGIQGAESDTGGLHTLLVTRDTPGLTVRRRDQPGDSPHGVPLYQWHHGADARLTFDNCRVPAANVLDAGPLAVGAVQVQALNLGVGRAAYEAAVEYAKLRVQGGRPIIGHEAIATMLAEIAVKLTVARSIVWQAAWAADHPEAGAGRGVSDLPLQTIARVFTSDAVHQAALQAAEVFGAMGVMRDMPMQKYVHDALVFVHADGGNSLAKLRIAEAVAGYS